MSPEVEKHPLGQLTRVPLVRCHGCNAQLSAAKGRGIPQPGDLLMCMDCGSLLALGSHLKALPVSEAGEAALPRALRGEIAAMRRRLSSCTGNTPAASE